MPHPSTIYARQLLPKKHGYPLWLPEPSDDLPGEYKEQGIDIGDVGTITDDGAFDYVFNICRPAEDPLNFLGVPSGFTPFPLDADDILLRPHMHSESTVITSSTVKTRQLQVDTGIPSLAAVAGAGVSVQLSSFSREGAALLLPMGASSRSLRRLQKMQRYVLKNGISWYHFINGSLERGVDNGSLYLVTACHKTSSWGVASFSNTCAGGELALQITAASVGQGQVAFSLDTERYSGMDTRTSPRQQILGTAKNQCVFLQGYKIALRTSVFSRQTIRVEALEGKTSGHRFRSLFHRKPHLFASSQRRESWQSQGSSSAIKDCEVSLDSLSESDELDHPSDIINEWMLDSMPEALISITHDTDWGAVMKLNEESTPDGDELLKRIDSTFKIVEDRDGIFLDFIAAAGDPYSNALDEATKIVESTYIPTYASASTVQYSVDGTISEENIYSSELTPRYPAPSSGLPEKLSLDEAVSKIHKATPADVWHTLSSRNNGVHRMRLKEYCDKQRYNLDYHIPKPSGDDHIPIWRAEALVEGKTHGRGQGETKSIAKEAAAEDACNSLTGQT